MNGGFLYAEGMPASGEWGTSANAIRLTPTGGIGCISEATLKSAIREELRSSGLSPAATRRFQVEITPPGAGLSDWRGTVRTVGSDGKTGLPRTVTDRSCADLEKRLTLVAVGFLGLPEQPAKPPEPTAPEEQGTQAKLALTGGTALERGLLPDWGFGATASALLYGVRIPRLGIDLPWFGWYARFDGWPSRDFGLYSGAMLAASLWQAGTGPCGVLQNLGNFAMLEICGGISYGRIAVDPRGQLKFASADQPALHFSPSLRFHAIFWKAILVAGARAEVALIRNSFKYTGSTPERSGSFTTWPVSTVVEFGLGYQF